MGFRRYVEVGRVVLVNDGDDAGKIAVIVEVIDPKRVLIHGPTTGVARQQFGLPKLVLTDFTIPLSRGAREKSLTKAINAFDLSSKWAASAWAKKLARRATRANLNDFDRFNTMLARKKKSVAVRREFAKLKKSSK